MSSLKNFSSKPKGATAASQTGGLSGAHRTEQAHKNKLVALAAAGSAATAIAAHKGSSARTGAKSTPLEARSRSTSTLTPIPAKGVPAFIPTAKLPDAGVLSASKTSPAARNAVELSAKTNGAGLTPAKATGTQVAAMFTADKVIKAISADALSVGVPVPGRFRFLTPTGLHLVPFKWLSVGAHKVAVPEVLIPELKTISISLESLIPIFDEFPRIKWVVSSIRKDFMGRDRGTATSHYLGKSIDLAGLADFENLDSPILYSPRVKSPRFADRRMFLRHLALAVDKAGKTAGWGAAAEGDHLHITTDLRGAWAYSTYRNEYQGDTTAHNADLLSRRLYKVSADGSIAPIPASQ